MKFGLRYQQPSRRHPGPMVRIRFPPAGSPVRTGFSGLVASSKTGGMGSAYSLALSCQMESDGLESEIRRLELQEQHRQEHKMAIIGDDTPCWSTDYLGTAPAPSAPIWARPLQGLRCRPFKLFELPAVYQPLPISIFRGRRDETIGIRIGIRRGRPLWLGCPGRGDLRANWTDDRYGSRDLLHRGDGPPDASPHLNRRSVGKGFQ